MLAAFTSLGLSRDRVWVYFNLYYWIYNFLKQKCTVFLNPSSHSEHWNVKGRSSTSPIKFVKLICSRLKFCDIRSIHTVVWAAIISFVQQTHWLIHINWTAGTWIYCNFWNCSNFNISYSFTFYLFDKNCNYNDNLTSFT